MYEYQQISGIDVYLPISICINSAIDDWEAFKSLLYEIYFIVSTSSPVELNLLNFISFIHTIQTPPHHTLLRLNLWYQKVPFYFHSQNEIPTVYNNQNIITWFTMFDTKWILSVYRCILSEKKIILHSDSSYTLHIIIDGIRQLLFPFQWMFTIISSVPQEGEDWLELPFPYMIGILSEVISIDYIWSKYHNEDYCIFDIINQKVYFELEKTFGNAKENEINQEVNNILFNDNWNALNRTEKVRKIKEVFLQIIKEFFGLELYAQCYNIEGIKNEKELRSKDYGFNRKMFFELWEKDTTKEHCDQSLILQIWKSSFFDKFWMNSNDGKWESNTTIFNNIIESDSSNRKNQSNAGIVDYYLQRCSRKTLQKAWDKYTIETFNLASFQWETKSVREIKTSISSSFSNKLITNVFGSYIINSKEKGFSFYSDENSFLEFITDWNNKTNEANINLSELLYKKKYKRYMCKLEETVKDIKENMNEGVEGEEDECGFKKFSPNKIAFKVEFSGITLPCVKPHSKPETKQLEINKSNSIRRKDIISIPQTQLFHIYLWLAFYLEDVAGVPIEDILHYYHLAIARDEVNFPYLRYYLLLSRFKSVDDITKYQSTQQGNISAVISAWIEKYKNKKNEEIERNKHGKLLNNLLRTHKKEEKNTVVNLSYLNQIFNANNNHSSSKQKKKKKWNNTQNKPKLRLESYHGSSINSIGGESTKESCNDKNKYPSVVKPRHKDNTDYKDLTQRSSHKLFPNRNSSWIPKQLNQKPQQEIILNQPKGHSSVPNDLPEDTNIFLYIENISSLTLSLLLSYENRDDVSFVDSCKNQPIYEQLLKEVHQLPYIDLTELFNSESPPEYRISFWLNCFNSLVTITILLMPTILDNFNDWISLINESVYNIGGYPLTLAAIYRYIVQDSSQILKNEIPFPINKICINNTLLSLIMFNIYFPAKDDIFAFSIYNHDKLFNQLEDRTKTWLEKCICSHHGGLWVNQYWLNLIPDFFNNRTIYERYQQYWDVDVFRTIQAGEYIDFTINKCNWAVI